MTVSGARRPLDERFHTAANHDAATKLRDKARESISERTLGARNQQSWAVLARRFCCALSRRYYDQLSALKLGVGLIITYAVVPVSAVKAARESM